jgi:hypothetical protein
MYEALSCQQKEALAATGISKKRVLTTQPTGSESTSTGYRRDKSVLSPDVIEDDTKTLKEVADRMSAKVKAMEGNWGNKTLRAKFDRSMKANYAIVDRILARIGFPLKLAQFIELLDRFDKMGIHDQMMDYMFGPPREKIRKYIR